MKKLIIEMADTPIKREYGLMDRRSLAENKGMFFKFPNESNLAFWMQNTYIPLDIAFIGNDGKILQIEAMYPLSTKCIKSKYKCRFALEVNQGWFKKNNIKEGSYIVGEIFNNKKIVLAKGFIEKIKNLLKSPFQKNKTDLPANINEKNENISKEINPPESNVEGKNYPDAVYVENEQQNQLNPTIQENRDVRGQIKLADDYNLKMEILYWTLQGHILPPRKIMPIPSEGYPIHNGKHGEYFVAFDMSPSIQGGEGWSIKGNQPKSFIIDNIVKLSLLDDNGQEMTPDMIAKMIQGKNNV